MIYAIIILTIMILGHACLFHFVFWRRIRDMLLIAKVAQSDDGDSKYRYLKFDLLALPLLFIVAPALGFGWYYTIKGIVGLFLKVPADVVVALPPLWEVWIIVALFMSMLGAAIPIDFVYRILLREQYQEYANASYRRNPRGVRKAWLFPWLNWGLSISLTALLALVLNFYMYFRSDSITFSRFFDVAETRYAYCDVAEIAHVARKKAPNGNIVERRHVAIRFNDGSIWTSIDGGRSSDRRTDDRIVQLLQDKTGLTPTSYDTLP